MVLKLTRIGNAPAVVLDQQLLDEAGINPETPVKVSVEGQRLVIEAAPTEPTSDEAFEEVVRRTGTDNAELFRRLAK
jgi:antitoxin component of MazEF toxin-antitoxin module